MRTPGWLGVILALLIALIAGGIGFAVGVNTTMATNASGAVATVPVAVGWHGWGWGFPFFPLIGFLFFFLVIAFIFGMVRRAAWGGRGWYGPRGWGPGPWTAPDGSSTDDPRRSHAWHQGAAAHPSAADQADGSQAESSGYRYAEGEPGQGQAGSVGQPTPAAQPGPAGQAPQQPTYGQPHGQPQSPVYGQQPYGQQPSGQPPYGQPTYGQPPLGQPQSSPPYGQPPYGQPQSPPPYGQPPYGPQPPAGDPDTRR